MHASLTRVFQCWYALWVYFISTSAIAFSLNACASVGVASSLGLYSRVERIEFLDCRAMQAVVNYVCMSNFQL